MNSPTFTIATISYNSGRWIAETIESILNSSFTDFELIISDDASTDNSWDEISKFSDPRIRKTLQKRNLGEYQNRNFVLSLARGKYFFFVDGDDILYEDSLKKFNQYIIQYPNVSSIWGIYTHTIFSVELPKLLTNIEALEWIYIKNKPIAFVGFSETLFKTSALLEAGLFSEKFEAGDTYIKKKIALSGSILLVLAGFSYWRVSEGQASKKLSTDYLGYKNNVLIDREIFSDEEFLKLNINHNKIRDNISVRNIKLLFTHTFLKGKFKTGINLFRQMKFSVSDIKYLFLKSSDDSIYN